MTEPVAGGEQPARKRRRRSILLLAPVVVIGGSLGVLQSDLVTRFAARALEEAVEAAIGEEVTIGRIEVGYLPPVVEVQGVVISHPATGDTIAAVRAIRVEPGLDGWRPILKRLTVDAPQVALHVDEDGLREFRGIPKGASKARPSQLPWRELVLRGGSFSLETPGARVEVTGIDAAPGQPGTTDLRVGDLRVRAGTIDQRATDLSFPGITLAPDGVAIPSIDVRTDALTLDGGVSVKAGGPIAGDLALSVDLGRLTGADPAGSHVVGRVDLDASLGGTTLVPEVGGGVKVADLVIWRMSSKGVLTATRIGDAFGPWRFEPGVDGAPDALALDGLEMAWGEGTLGVEARVIPSTKELTGTLLAEGIHLARILQSVGVAPTPWVDLTGDIEANVFGTVSPFRLEGPFEINVDDFYVKDGPIDGKSDLMLATPPGTVVGRLDVDATRLVLDGRVTTGLSFGRARAEIGFAPYGPLSVDVDFPQLDLSVLRPLGDAELGGFAEVEGWLGGRYDEPLAAEATLSVEDAVVLGLPIADHLTANLESDLKRLHFTDIRARLGETDYQGDFELAFTDPMYIDTQVYVGSGHIHDLAGIFVDIGPADGLVSGTIVLAGEPYHLDGDVALQLRDVDLYGERFGTGYATAWMDDGELTVEALQLERGSETVLARGSVKRGFAMNVEVLSDGLTLPGLDHLDGMDIPLDGELTIDAQVGGTLFDPAPRGRIAATRTYYDRTRLADSVVTFTSDDGILAWEGGLLGEAMRTRGTLGMWGEQPYEAEARFSGFPLHLFYPRGEDGSPVEARVTGDLSLAGRFGDTPTPVDIEGRLDEVVARWDGHVLSNPAPWVFAVHGTSLQVPRLSLLGNDGTSFGFEGYTTGRGQMAFRGDGVVNLDLARAFVPELDVAQGMADVTVGIERAADGVAVHLGAELDDATLRSGYFPADFEELSARIEATSDRYVIRDVKAKVGGGTFASTESRIDAEGWVPRRYELEGTLEDARVQYLDYLPPMVGDAELRFDGPVDDLLLSGRIDIAEMVFTDRVDWEAMVLSLREERLTGSAPEEGAKYFNMDLDVKADDTIRLRNNVADAEASAQLRIIGDTARPGMVGEIVVAAGGEVYLHEREFEVTRGELRYIDPYTFDPDLDILLETDVRSHEQDYHVTYGVTGPFSDWRTNTASDPALAQADVNALLLFGVTREELERYGGLGTALVAETSDLLLAQTALSRTNLFVIDRWSLVSGVSERGSSTVTSDLRLVAEKQISGFDLTVEKRLGVNLESDWYLSIERRIAEKLYATAYVATRQEGRSLPIGAAYGAEFKWKWEFD